MKFDRASPVCSLHHFTISQCSQACRAAQRPARRDFDSFDRISLSSTALLTATWNCVADWICIHTCQDVQDPSSFATGDCSCLAAVHGIIPNIHWHLGRQDNLKYVMLCADLAAEHRVQDP
eukprot:scpid109222/ scgid26385/ 